jgi:hypothetical protein
MDIISAYQQVGTYRGAAAMCGVNHKTVKRIIERAEAGGKTPDRAPRARNHDSVADLAAGRVAATSAQISAKRLLPPVRVAGYPGPTRNFRRLVADARKARRRENHQARRPAVWAPGEVLAIDWGSVGALHVFCAVLAWSRVRFVRFAGDERSETTPAMLAGCFEKLGGVRPKTPAEKAFAGARPRRGAVHRRVGGLGEHPAGLGPGRAAALRAAHGDAALTAALERAVAFRRWRAEDVRSILAAGAGAPHPRPAGDALVIDLPRVPVRPLSDYRIGGAS